MRKFNALFLGLLALSSTVFVSCKDKDDDEEVAVPVVTTNENSIPNGTTKFSLSVHVIPSSINGKTAGLSGATVTVSNNGGRSTATTDASGIAVFNNLSEGDVAIFVASSGFASVNAKTTLTKSFNTNNGTDGSDVDQVQFANEEVTLKRLGASASGRIVGDLDGLATPITPVSNVKIIATGDSHLEPNVFTATTDGTGSFTFYNLPENETFNLSISYVTNLGTTSVPANQLRVWGIAPGETTSFSSTVNRSTVLSDIEIK